MALQFVDTDGTLTIPQAAAKWETAPSNAGIATRGVVVLVGEADLGPSYSEEGDGLPAAIFGPGEFGAVQAKYGAGPLVDAFRVAANPSRDPAVRGAPTAIVCVKTNGGLKATAALTGGYGVLRAKLAGAIGNLIYGEVAARDAEVAAYLEYTFIHTADAETIYLAANGGTRVALVFGAVDPAAWKAANVAGLVAQNIALTGGVASNPAPAAGNLAVTVNANDITITLSGAVFASVPTAGQTLIIPLGAGIQGAGNENRGQYIVSSATSSTIVARKVAELDGTAAVAPVAVAGPVPSAAAEFTCYTRVRFTSAVAGNAAKTVTFDLDAGAGPGRHFYTAYDTKVIADAYAYSAVEASRNILVRRSYDAINETLAVGGSAVLSIGRSGTVAAPVVVSATTIDFNSEFTVTKSQFRTLGDLAAYINSRTNWFAEVLPAFRSLPLSVLDYGTYDARQNNVAGVGPARIKRDAYDTAAAVASSRAVEFVAAPTSGLPSVQAVFFLAGGERGGTTDAGVQSALLKAGTVRGNFIVSLFSQDATADIADGVTDAASTYTVDSVNAAVSEHVSQFSQFKKRRPRQGFCSVRKTFALSKTAAQTLANFRVRMEFLDHNALGSNGVQWFQPWMGSVLAAGMQAAGFYRPFFNKSIACSGVRSFVGDFNPQDDDQVESALLAGLGVTRERDGGGFGFVSDQTTYTQDNNSVYNSVQAVYVADVIAQTVAQRLERAFVGQSFADVTSGVALSYLKGIMADLKRLKLIAASDDAIDGYKDAKIQIRPPAMLVSAEVKVATGLYFIPIKFLVTEVQQTASQG